MFSLASFPCEGVWDLPCSGQTSDFTRNFHETLYGASDLKFFQEIADNAIERVERQIRAQLVMSNCMERTGREHFGILEACKKGDAELAASLIRDHIQGAKKSLLKHLARLGLLQNSGSSAHDLEKLVVALAMSPPTSRRAGKT